MAVIRKFDVARASTAVRQQVSDGGGMPKIEDVKIGVDVGVISSNGTSAAVTLNIAEAEAFQRELASAIDGYNEKEN